MNALFENLLAGMAGGLLGLLFFGGLWWTLRRALASPKPALWFGVSALLRFAIATAGIVVISAGQWQRLLLCLIGFWAARWLVQRLTAETAGATELRFDSSRNRAMNTPSPITQTEESAMQIQINTDNNIDGKEALTTHVESAVEHALRHLKDRLTRVEVHLSDENGGKHGINDKRCMMEARPKNHQPVSVSFQAGSIHQAVDGATSKLKALLETVLGRLDDQHRHAAIDPTEAV